MPCFWNVLCSLLGASSLSSHVWGSRNKSSALHSAKHHSGWLKLGFYLICLQLACAVQPPPGCSDKSPAELAAPAHDDVHPPVHAVCHLTRRGSSSETFDHKYSSFLSWGKLKETLKRSAGRSCKKDPDIFVQGVVHVTLLLILVTSYS